MSKSPRFSTVVKSTLSRFGFTRDAYKVRSFNGSNTQVFVFPNADVEIEQVERCLVAAGFTVEKDGGEKDPRTAFLIVT